MLSALDEAGKPVDWWFMYKVSGKCECSTDRKATGGEYVYFDAAGARKKSAKLALSDACVNEDKGALYNTLNSLYSTNKKDGKQRGYFLYNDENPVTGKVVGSRGHTKGVLAFDLESHSAFWLVQSTPKFPSPRKYNFPKTGMEMAQTLLCVTLESAAVAGAIARQMYAAQQPNVYFGSSIPADLKKRLHDHRVLLMKDQIAKGNTPLTSCVPFKSRGGEKFLAIAKNRWWGQDFYNDLVGPRLHENLEVETWEHDPVPANLDSDKIHKVQAMKSVDLHPIGAPFSWSEEFDHAKLAISAPTEKVHWVCVGDINFTKAQEKRGGGTVAFQCEPLWKSLVEILSLKAEPPRKKARSRS